MMSYPTMAFTRKKLGPKTLTDETKFKIRQLKVGHDMTTRDLAERFHVTQKTIQIVLQESA